MGIAARFGVGCLMVALFTGCGADDDAGGGGGSGTVTEAWSSYCTGTFTQDTPILDVFGDPVFTARAGEAYLLSELGSQQAEFIYLASGGPADFTVEAEGGALPFESDCVAATAQSYYAAFEDVTVYADEAMTTELCRIGETTALPSAGGMGYAVAGAGFSLSGPQTYEIFLGAFEPQCGAASGFVRVPETQLWGATTWLVPIVSVLGPN